jgi:hypothetical protein
MIAENARNGPDGNQQTANLQDPLNAVLVSGNVDSPFAVVFVVVSENGHYRLILMKQFRKSMSQ